MRGICGSVSVANLKYKPELLPVLKAACADAQCMAHVGATPYTPMFICAQLRPYIHCIAAPWLSHVHTPEYTLYAGTLVCPRYPTSKYGGIMVRSSTLVCHCDQAIVRSHVCVHPTLLHPTPLHAWVPGSLPAFLPSCACRVHWYAGVKFGRSE